jgi:amino acid adenylation domain-containing protein
MDDDRDRSSRSEPPSTDTGRRWPSPSWNETTTDYPRDACIHDLFEDRAREAPGSVALVQGPRALTYGELDGRSNRLASRLRQRGVGPGVLVGVLIGRSLESVVASLSVLKAGGAYVPLDPSHPADLLTFQMDDIHAPVLLTTTALRALLPSHSATVICLDEDEPEACGPSLVPRPRLVSAGDLACIMYTSGTTGRPKGVMVTHRGVVRLLFGIDYVRLGPDTVTLHASPPAFDASTFEVWGPILHGGRCIIAPERVLTARGLGRLLREGRVNTLWLTAALYNAVIDEAPDALAGLEQLLIGGEALSATHVRRGLERLPTTRLINGYGPTEGTTFTCCYPIPRTFGEEAKTVPIGLPIGNTRVYLLDGSMRPVPIGTAGELYVGEDGVALGYLNRPRETAEAFIPDPFSTVPRARLYRTGDLARWRPDGLIEFLGRNDSQVKVRGYRIELGAIEAILGRCRGVAGVAVVVREDAPGEKRLVAYLTAAPGSPGLEAPVLRAFLEKSLPSYMIPSAFVTLGALPRTANGKLDRAALPAPFPSRSWGDAPFIAPRDEVEARLVSTWEEVLGMAPIGVRDDFFELGGNSLTALRLVARVEEAFGTRLPRLALLRASTVERLAVVLGGLGRGEGQGMKGSSLVAIQAGGPELPFFFLGGGTAVFDGRDTSYLHRLAHHLGPSRPVYTFVGENLDRGITPDLLVERLASCFVNDLCAAFPDGPYHLAGHSFGAFLALEMARQLVSLGKPVGVLGLLDPLSPLHPRKLAWWERPDRRLAGLVVTAASRWRGDSARPAVPFPPAAPDIEHEGRLDVLKEAIAGYTSAPRYYPGPATLFRPNEELPTFNKVTFDDPFNGLARFIGGGIAVHQVPGSHSTMVNEAGLRVIVEEMSQDLGGR